jgi:hypothetical protein
VGPDQSTPVGPHQVDKAKHPPGGRPGHSVHIEYALWSMAD